MLRIGTDPQAPPGASVKCQALRASRPTGTGGYEMSNGLRAIVESIRGHGTAAAVLVCHWGGGPDSSSGVPAAVNPGAHLSGGSPFLRAASPATAQ